MVSACGLGHRLSAAPPPGAGGLFSGWQTTVGARLGSPLPLHGLGWLLVCLALCAGCATRGVERAKLPPIPDARRGRPVAEEPPRPMKDVPVDPQTPELGAPPADGSGAEPAGEPPSVLANLPPATPPNELAAARLVEEARANLAAHDVDAALDQLERAIAIDATNPYAYYFLGEAHFERGTYAQALAFADRAAALGARTQAPWLARAYALRGKILEKVGRFPEARAAFQQALDTDPRNPAAAEGLRRLER